MKPKICQTFAVLGAVIILAFFARQSRAQLTGILSSDVEGFFGSTSDTFQQSEPPISPPWPATGFALPYPPSGLPAGSVPPLYAGYPNPTLAIPPNIPFPAPLGHAPGSPFSDGTTTADYHIFGGIGGPATFTRNAYVRLGNNTANLMYLNQPSTATGYAYEEEEFAIDYSVGAAGLGPGATIGTRPYLVYGNFLTPGSAEFGAQVNYYWYAQIPGTTTLAAPVLLGTLQYQDYINNVTGPFVNLVPDTFGSNFLAGTGPTVGGVLELTGDMYLIGDPVTINVEAVPEPASISLVVLTVLSGGLWLANRRRRLAHC